MLLVLCAAHNTYGQGVGPGAIKIGDRMPVRELHNMVNYPSRVLTFADHKPKLTILDFWSTGCTGCVAAWPKMLALQKEFGSDLQIILVNRYQTEKIVKEFIARRKELTGIDMRLPISCMDSSLWKAFSGRGLPRYYWVDANGVIASATLGDEVKSKNIKKWIETGPFQMDQIIEDMIYVTGNRPIFVDGNGGNGRANAFLWSSSLSRGFRDIAGQSNEYRDSISGYGVIKTGTTIGSLYSTAYNNRLADSHYLTWMPESRYTVIAEDTTKYYNRVSGEPTSAPRYNYQLICGRPVSRGELQIMMRQDLDRYFGLNVRWEKMRKFCLVLTMFDSTKAQGKSRGWGDAVTPTQTNLDGVGIRDAIFAMEQNAFFRDRRPIVDETGFKGLLSGVIFDANAKDLKAYDKGLSHFGMHIREEVREVDILILEEPKNPN
jgi:thiol-disulfide isomerase/thioredoxin